MAYAFYGELKKSQSLKFQPSCLGKFYTRTIQNSNFGTGWTEHVLHICGHCGRIGGGVGIERGEMKWRGDKQLVAQNLCTLRWTPKCSTIKVSTTVFGHVLYTYMSSFQFWH